MSGVASKIAQDRAKAAGLGSPKNPIKFAGQEFEKLKAECLASKKLFEDPQFKADQSSLGKEKNGLEDEEVLEIEWKRPNEIMRNPKFIVGGRERDDVCQGELGDCWFLGSIACLTLNKDCVSRVIPQDQYFDKDYAGIFRFMFWQYGQWVEVVVDDRLPTKDDTLIFASSGTSNEFWSALMEKAYAKLHGSYEALIAGDAMDALEDFTGGVGELYQTYSASEELFEKIQRALLKKSLLGCGSVSYHKSYFGSDVRGCYRAVIVVKELTVDASARYTN
ncbi:calpain-2 catalytic subunit-like [Anomaloglossus baeobatrachus]|uniref:calpain-2 catalytic subunit-like n=1 Tax=Anomaloglossus baeobatrachus TaxID=238106 RepID=UPI003F50207A